MISTFFMILGAYLLYRFIFGFVIPVFRTTSKIKQQFRTMQQQMNEQMNTAQNSTPPQSAPQQANSAQVPKHEYIEFEEVK